MSCDGERAGRLSTSACWPRFSDNFGASRRKHVGRPSGANGTITRPEFWREKLCAAGQRFATVKSTARDSNAKKKNNASRAHYLLLIERGRILTGNARPDIESKSRSAFPAFPRHGAWRARGAPQPKRSVIMDPYGAKETTHRISRATPNAGRPCSAETRERTRVLLLGAHHRRLLPALVRFAAARAENVRFQQAARRPKAPGSGRASAAGRTRRRSPVRRKPPPWRKPAP